MIHHIKAIEPFYSDVKSGIKTFELRKNDRDYQVGDEVDLMQFIDDKITGRHCYVEITYVLENFAGLESGYCILGIKPCPETNGTGNAKCLKDRFGIDLQANHEPR